MRPEHSALLSRLLAAPEYCLPVRGRDLVTARQLEASGLATLQADATSPDAAHATATETSREALETRATELMGCTEGSPEEAELKAIADALDAYDGEREDEQQH